MKYPLLITLIICFSCSSSDNVPPAKPNSAPNAIKIDDISFDGKTVTIDWSDAQDADNDQIFYKLYINSILITESTESIGNAILDYNADYLGRIIATDRKGGTTEVNFEFSSLKSKILFYPERNGNLTAFDLYTKQPLWKAKTSNIETHTLSENLIYSGIEGINGLDILTGDVLWTSTPSGHYNSQYRNILVDETNVYAFDSDSNLHCVSKITGGKLWERSFLEYYAPLALDEERIFVCSRNNDYLYAINKKTGLTDWSIGIIPNTNIGLTRIDTNPMIVNENIYFGDRSGRFYSVNRNSGTINWSTYYPQSGSFGPSPTLYENQIISGMGGYQGDLISLDLYTGTENWRFTAQQVAFTTSPFVYKDKIYIGATGNGMANLFV